MQLTSPAHAAPERWHALDAVRGLALLLGVVLHATLSYLPGASFWYITGDQDPSNTLSGLFFVIHSFRMLLFFLIAGLFARMALEHWGLRRFLRDRARRIAAPLLLAWFPVFATIVAVIVWASWLKSGGVLPKDPPPGPAFTPDDFPLTHLWFLYVLLLCYGAALLLRGAMTALDRGQRLSAVLERCWRALLGPWAPLVLALPLAATLLQLPAYSPWFGIPTPDHSLYPNAAAVVGFGLAFLLGWNVHRQAGLLLARIQRFRLYYLLLGVGALAVCLAQLGFAPAYLHGLGTHALQWYAYAYAVAGWSLALALIGYALHYCSGYSAWRRYLADASYWIYLAHLPLVMALQVAASLWAGPWWIEYPLQVLCACVLLLLSYHYGVRSTWIGALLNGRRYPRRASPALLAKRVESGAEAS